MRALLRLAGPDLDRDVPLDPSGAEVTFGRDGRDSSADVRLVDPGRFISRKHVALRSAGDWVEMHILSAVNGAETSRGSVRPGERARLGEGDYFQLGPYTITVCSVSPSAALPAGQAPALNEAGTDLAGSTDDLLPGTAQVTTSIDHWLSAESGDDLYPSRGDARGDGRAGAPHERGAGDGSQASDRRSAGLPSDDVWEPALDAPIAEAPLRHGGPAAPEPRASNDNSALWAAFVKGLGLPRSHLVDEQTAAHAGKMVKLLVEGLADLLSVRAQIRRELRVVDRTMLTGHDTNQFKAGLHITELTQYLFSAHVGAGYMQPDRAVRECITELQVHEHATLMAVRAALEGALREFEPVRLQQELLSNKPSPFRLLNNARSWRTYEDYFEKRSRNLADWLEKVFDRHFTETYTRESNRLKILHGRHADP